jgi:predicted secreted Zn-dependent protease
MSITLSSLGESTRNYSFTAATLEEAVQQMSRLGPRDGDGHHSASCDIQAGVSLQNLQISIVPGTAMFTPNVPAEFSWAATAAITQATLEYRVIFLFPQWTNVGNLSQPVQNEWRRYTGCLWRHERGHVRVAMPVLRRYVQQFQNLRITGSGQTRQSAEQIAQRDCRSQIADVYSLLARDTQEAGNRYDRSTRHGRTQGAQLRTRAARGSRH